jgi:hypothetical protein
VSYQSDRNGTTDHFRFHTRINLSLLDRITTLGVLRRRMTPHWAYYTRARRHTEHITKELDATLGILQKR